MVGHEGSCPCARLTIHCANGGGLLLIFKSGSGHPLVQRLQAHGGGSSAMGCGGGPMGTWDSPLAGVPHFYFAVGPTNCALSPGLPCLLCAHFLLHDPKPDSYAQRILVSLFVKLFMCSVSLRSVRWPRLWVTLASWPRSGAVSDTLFTLFWNDY